MKVHAFLPAERKIKQHLVNFRAELKDPTSNIRIKNDDARKGVKRSKKNV